MSIHIVFTNGSNPYVKFDMDPKQFARELLRWTIIYNLEYQGTTGGDILNFSATERKPNPLFGE